MIDWLRGFLPATPAAAAWLALGIFGQLLFASRWLVQLIASERTGQSTMPVAFWWLSLFGGLLVFVYGLHARDVVVIVGQWGVAVYLRNLVLLRRARRAAARPAETT